MQIDYYRILGCSRESTYEEIKQAYHARLLRFHPDKNNDVATGRDTQEFHEIQKAWSVLKQSQSKKEYDAICKQEELEKESQLVYARLSLDELEENIEDDTLFYRCRCGDRYSLQREDLCKDSVLQVTCEGCTLVILVEI